MKILSDLFAVFLFFITYIITKDMIAATAVAVIVGIAQAALTFWKHRKLDTMQWVSLILIVFFWRRNDSAERQPLYHVETDRSVLDRRHRHAVQPPCR